MSLFNVEGRQQLGRQWRVEVIGNPDLPSSGAGAAQRWLTLQRY